jgi:endonuclease YncB( thermonuclease family)
LQSNERTIAAHCSISILRPTKLGDRLVATATEAANELDALIARHPAGCIEVDRDRYNRPVAVCTVTGIELADWMVRNGLPLDWPRYSKGD